MRPVRVLIIDDSATMRKIIGFALASNPAIEVVGEAPDPTEAFRLVDSLDPDVITLDIEMPKMNGIDFLRRVMKHRPRPVIMVSTLTVSGAAVTIEALALGAFDCVAKPTLKDARSFRDLVEKVIAAGAGRNRARPSRPSAERHDPAPLGAGQASVREKVVAIGASTGGPPVLETILGKLPATTQPPVVVAQHMPEVFTRSMAERLNKLCPLNVIHVETAKPVEPGNIYLARGGKHMQVHKTAAGKATAARTLGIVLTGIGADGTRGAKDIHAAGGIILAQNQATSVVYGMPKAAFELGAVERQLPLHRLSPAILELCADSGARSIA